MPWVNASGEREEKVAARENAAAADLERRGVVIAECPSCRLPLEVRRDGTPSPCNYRHEGVRGCGRMVTFAEVAD